MGKTLRHRREAGLICITVHLPVLSNALDSTHISKGLEANCVKCDILAIIGLMGDVVHNLVDVKDLHFVLAVWRRQNTWAL
jgi:hypothetical protein